MSHSYISYWEHDIWLKDIDVAIIGSGIVGLSSAYFLKKKYPKKKIVVFERGFLPHGATTRNAGFACFGSVTEILSDIGKTGKAKAYNLVKDRFDGLHSLIHLHGPENICYENFGGYEVFTPTEEHIYNEARLEIDSLNKDLQDVLKIKSNVYEIPEPSKSNELGLKNIVGSFYTPWEGQIHSGMLVRNLVRLCREVGVEIITGINIEEFATNNGQVYLKIANNIEVKANQLVITVNGFAKTLVPELAVFPARGQVLVTSPIEGLQLKGTFHHNEGYDYFRNIGNRVLLGGGRNLDFEKERTTEMQRNDTIYQYLISLLKDVIIPNKSFTIEHEWSGTMGVGDEKSPIIQFVDNNVLVAVRMGGMGVAIGTNVAMKVRDMI